MKGIQRDAFFDVVSPWYGCWFVVHFTHEISQMDTTERLHFIYIRFALASCAALQKKCRKKQCQTSNLVKPNRTSSRCPSWTAWGEHVTSISLHSFLEMPVHSGKGCIKNRMRNASLSLSESDTVLEDPPTEAFDMPRSGMLEYGIWWYMVICFLELWYSKAGRHGYTWIWYEYDLGSSIAELKT